ncbi:MAG: hypothetical protein GX564_10700 [Oligosphaeraceae bacterium]|nr:hypothetical protein [Oligosphaeraceae bacterium]
MKKLQPRAAFVGFGEINTPREFIEQRCADALQALRQRGVIVHSTAPVSDDPEGKQAERARQELLTGQFDALVLCVAGWIPSWAVLKTIEPFKHLPVLLWGLSGWRENGRFVTTADQAGTTALRAPLQALGYNCQYLVNFKDEAPRWDEAADFLFAASARAALRQALIGMIGYRDMKLYGTLYDGMTLKKQLGCEFEHFDLLEIQQLMQALPQAEISRLAGELRQRWDFLREPQAGTLENSVRLALACKRKIEERGYAAFSFCDVDGIKKLLQFAPAGALTLLHEELDLPSIPENDSYGAVTQVLLQALTGEVPAYLEFYEFSRNSALMGVPDYVPGNVVEGRVTVMPNAFGDFGEGLLNVSRLRTGTVTIVRLACQDAQLLLHAALGEAVQPEAWEEAGWASPAPQLPSLEIKFPCCVEPFLQEVQGQHYILAYGNILPRLRAFAQICGLPLKVFPV